jgi:PAS domain S-box-containing protein
MNRLSKFVVERSRQTWAFALLIALGSGLLTGWWLYTNQIHERLEQLQIKADRCSYEIASKTLQGNLMGALELLAALDSPLRQEALNRLEVNNAASIQLLDSITRVRNTDGAFLVGKDGIIKSSWGKGKSSTGQNVFFRPYVQAALKGTESIYAAVGTTTGLRTLYYAVPLRTEATPGAPVIGALVGRGNVDWIDSLLSEKSDTALLISPQQVAFAGSHQKFIGCLATQPTPEILAALRKNKQFGKMFDGSDYKVLPFSVTPGIRTVNGRATAVVVTPLNWNDPSGDWNVVLMEDLSRTASVNSLWKGGLSAGLLVLLFQLLLFSMLRSRHAKLLAGQELEKYAHAQETAAAHKIRLAAVAMRLQQATTRAELAQFFLEEAHTVFNAFQGTVYLMDDTGERLCLAAGYACAQAPPAKLALGEGLLGQSALEKRTVVLDKAAMEFMTIRSGLGSAKPVALLMTPVLLGETLLGMIELALLQPPESSGTEQLEELARLLAMNFELIKRREHTEQMLTAAAVAELDTAEQLAFQQILLDTIPYPVFTKDADARFIGFNRAYEKTFRVSRQELIGKKVLDLLYLPEADRIAYQTEDEALIASADSIQREVSMPFADGRMHQTLYFATGFRRHDGTPGGLVGTFIDITSLKDADRAPCAHETDNQETTL